MKRPVIHKPVTEATSRINTLIIIGLVAIILVFLVSPEKSAPATTTTVIVGHQQPVSSISVTSEETNPSLSAESPIKNVVRIETDEDETEEARATPLLDGEIEPLEMALEATGNDGLSSSTGSKSSQQQQQTASSTTTTTSRTKQRKQAEESEDDNDNSVEYPVYDKGANVDGVQALVRAKDVNEKDFDAEDVVVSTSSSSSAASGESSEGAALTDDELFEDAAAYNSAPIVQVLPESASMKYRMIVLQHERYYRAHPSRLYVPRLRKTAKLTVEEFATRFIKTSQPVIIPFAAMRHLGFNSRSWTLDELLEKYPNYKRPLIYKYGAPGPGEMDLGPAIWCLKQGTPLKKTGSGRNFPRNTKVSLEKISKLGAQYPPYILPGTGMLLPSLWFATSTSSTKFHSDCCDNYAMMISGTKLWTVAPPSEARILKPACMGGLCWVKQLEHPDEHATSPKEIELRDRLQTYTFELRPNEMLFLPTGWFHHVENVGPTIMINYWTKGGPGFLRFIDGNAFKTSTDAGKERSAQSYR